MRRVRGTAFALALVMTDMAMADGLIRNGHPFGPYTSITLTTEQQERLNAGEIRVRLTRAQHDKLARSTGDEKDLSIQIFPVDYYDCACDLENVGVRVAVDTVEISHLLYDGKMSHDSTPASQARWQKRTRIENQI